MLISWYSEAMDWRTQVNQHILVISVNSHGEQEWTVEVPTWRKAWKEVDGCGADRENCKVDREQAIIWIH